MTTQEHLMKIRIKCVELLAVAEKRTQGQWSQDHLYVDTDDNNDLIKAEGNINNAAFIVSCAGPAEAGWRATIAAIDGLLALSIVPNVEAPDDMHTAWEQVADEAKEHLSKLIAAWPEELLS
jgi:hypothetical protein